MKGMSKAGGVVLVSVFLGAGVLAADAKSGGAKTKPAAMVMKTPDEMKWIANPARAEVTIAVAWGDPEKGAHGAFHRLKAGFDAGLHTHSSDIRLVVVSGTLVSAIEGGPEKKLPAGSYEFQPHGVRHVTKCDAGSDCVLFVTSSGKFDLLPADAKK